MSPARAARRYALVVFLIWLPVGLLIAPMVLLMLERGLGIASIAAVGVVYSVTTAVLELPTGGLADVIGRRGVLIASAVASMLGLVVFGFATSAAGFAVAAALRGVSRALGSGPPEAWYVDTVHAAAGPDADLVPGLARGEVAASAALAVGTLAGGIVPTVLGTEVGGLPPLAVPVLAAAALETVRIVVTATGMPEPRHGRQRLNEVLRAVPLTVAAGVRLGVRDVVLIRLFLAAAGVGVALAAIELLTPSWLATATGTAEGAGLVYAVVAAAGFAADAVGSASSVRLVRWTGSAARAAGVALVVAAAAVVALALSAVGTNEAAVVGAAASYCLLFAALGATSAPQADLLHRRVTSHERATVLSIQSLVFQLVGAAGALGLGYFAAHQGASAAFAAAAAALCLAAACFVRLRSNGQTLPTAAADDAECRG